MFCYVRNTFFLRWNRFPHVLFCEKHIFLTLKHISSYSTVWEIYFSYIETYFLMFCCVRNIFFLCWNIFPHVLLCEKHIFFYIETNFLIVCCVRSIFFLRWIKFPQVLLCEKHIFLTLKHIFSCSSVWETYFSNVKIISLMFYFVN